MGTVCVIGGRAWSGPGGRLASSREEDCQEEEDWEARAGAWRTRTEYVVERKEQCLSV